MGLRSRVKGCPVREAVFQTYRSLTRPEVEAGSWKGPNMAGDWIKMRADLDEDPAVIGIAILLGMDEDHVVGKLWKLWRWANLQTIDGNAVGVTETWIDRYICVTGFASAMCKVGWLVINADGFSIPKFDRHNSESAKERALTLARVSKHRAKKRNAETVTKPLPEKRRGEDNSSLSCEPENSFPSIPPTPCIGTCLDNAQARDPTVPCMCEEGELAGFNEFIEAYPKGSNGKGPAQKIWQELRPSKELRAEIMSALEDHKKSDRWKKGYICSASRWLNEERWKDVMPKAETISEQAARILKERKGSK